MGRTSTTVTYVAPKATEFGKITQKGHYAVLSHSRSPILYQWNARICDVTIMATYLVSSCTVSDIRRIIVLIFDVDVGYACLSLTG